MDNKFIYHYRLSIFLLLFLIPNPKLFSQQTSKTNLTDTIVQKVKLDSSPYHDIRGGLANCYIKFTHEKTGRVAFLGGSITQNSGWRDMICKYLQDRFPETKFDFVNAGIGSTGSTPGAFRLQSDVLDKGEIDLLFEEAAVNDRTNMFDSIACIRGMEGIVSHARRTNSYLDIVLLYFVDPNKINDYNCGKIPYEIYAHNKVAIHYNLPSLNLAKEITERINNNEFSWERDFVDLHPSPFGQELYYNSIRSFLESCWEKAEGQDERLPHKSPELIDKFSYINARYVDIRQAKPKVAWTFENNWSPTNSLVIHKMCTNVPVLFSNKPETVVEFSFRGRAVGICAVTGPDAGTIVYCIDGKYTGEVDLYTQWSNEYWLPWFVVFKDDLRSSNHILQIRISEKKNVKSEGNACRIIKFLVNK